MRLPARLPRLRRRTSAILTESATPDLLLVVPEPVVPPPLRTPRAAAWWIVPAALLVGGAATTMAWWLLSSLPSLPATAEEATARQGAIQTALAVAAGIGAAITLMLTFRRQRHQEHSAHVTAYLTERNAQLTEQIAERNARLAEQVAEHNRQDATERRVTDLYTKAGEQLGHSSAAVRLTGLYALERLAQDNPAHRQTIINVICAYLRMPYAPPALLKPIDPARERAEALRAAHRRHHASRNAARGKRPAAASTAFTEDVTPSKEVEEERQVRLTAQRILTEHLRNDQMAEQQTTTLGGPRFWEGMRIDLTGATLIDLDFAGCWLTDARFDGATFKGDARFEGATFTGHAEFIEAIFKGDAEFSKVTFEGYVWFGGVVFRGNARFAKATFKNDAGFVEAAFEGNAVFTWANFELDAWFDEVAFEKDVQFGGVTFRSSGRFNGAVFERDARFGRVIFARHADFVKATFKRDVYFDEVAFEGGAWFREVAFGGSARFDSARILKPDPEHSWEHIWPVGWEIVRQQDGSALLQRAGTEPTPPILTGEEDGQADSHA
ncbi:pentapeptide repeat-containing protein [Streptosporangium sp. NPDC051023]|uniref:pentapeptide repeat-containing protein n=1 Tax=Streptosporangium sp. NPDC051023 TaxID=3155410 RepID=UPI0034509871